MTFTHRHTFRHTNIIGKRNDIDRATLGVFFCRGWQNKTNVKEGRGKGENKTKCKQGYGEQNRTEKSKKWGHIQKRGQNMKERKKESKKK